VRAKTVHALNRSATVTGPVVVNQEKKAGRLSMCGYVNKVVSNIINCGEHYCDILGINGKEVLERTLKKYDVKV
jgi:hypothetical protein